MTLLRTNWAAGDTAHVAEHNLIGSKVNKIVSLLDYGALGDDSTDNSAAIQAAVDAVSALGGGVIYAPTGTYRMYSLVNWASNVSLFGDGMGATIFKLYNNGYFHGLGSLAAPTTNCVFQDFEVDGTNQYADVKAFFLPYVKRNYYLRVYVHDTGATGFGSDFMLDSVYDSCVAEGCGRGRLITDPGCSGFGVGTGKHQVEAVSVINCIARNNKRYGAFFEVQYDAVTQYASRGCRVIGGYFEGNQWGIGDCGVEGLVISGASVNDNVAEGIYVGGPSLLDIAGTNGIIVGCEVARNGALGIRPAAPTGYVLSGNNEHDNGA